MLDFFDYLYIVTGALGVGSVISTYNKYKGESSPSYSYYDDKHLVADIVIELIKDSKDGHLWTIAGELDPLFYIKVKDIILYQIDNHNMSVSAIAGPNICIEDKLYDQFENKEIEYWQAHPLLEVIHRSKNKNASLYLRKKGISSFETHCFCSSKKTNQCISERAHIELAPSPVILEEGSSFGYGKMFDRFNDHIENKNVELWDPESENAADISKTFKRYSVFYSEAKHLL